MTGRAYPLPCRPGPWRTDLRLRALEGKPGGKTGRQSKRFGDDISRGILGEGGPVMGLRFLVSIRYMASL